MEEKNMPLKKRRDLKIATIPVIVGTQSMIKKGRDKHINKIPSSNRLYKIFLKCTLQNCSSL